MKLIDPTGGIRILGGNLTLHVSFAVVCMLLPEDLMSNTECAEFGALIDGLMIAHWTVACTTIGSMILDIFD
jgi:hypothetical protein